MSITKSNVSPRNISRKISNSKEKNIFELISEIPKEIWVSELPFETEERIIDYCEIILREANRVNSEAVDELEFDPNEDIRSFIFKIEHIVVRGNPLFYNEYGPKHKIYITDESDPLEVALGISEIEPLYIYSAYMDAIYNIKSTALKIGYAHFLMRYASMTANGIDGNFQEMYPDLHMELEQIDDYEGDEEYEEYHQYLVELQDFFNSHQKEYSKILRYYMKYRNKDLKEFYDYEPKNDKESDLKFSLEIALKNIPFIYSRYGFAEEEEYAPFEIMFNIFVADDDNAERENNAINNYAQNGVASLQVMLDITKEIPDMISFESDVKVWNDLEKSLNKIINITSEKC